MHCCKSHLIAVEISSSTHLYWDVLQTSGLCSWILLAKSFITKKKPAFNNLISWMAFKNHMDKCLVINKNEATLLVWCFFVFSPIPDLWHLFTIMANNVLFKAISI